MRRVPYASAIGSIMYVVRCTRPDVAFAQNLCSHFQQYPGEIHWAVVKTILKYSRNTKDIVRVYGAKPEVELRIPYYAAAKAEYIDVAEASMESIWMRKCIDRLGDVVPSIKRPMEMLFLERKIILKKVHTDDNVAELFIKPMPYDKDYEHAMVIGIVPASSLMQICDLNQAVINDGRVDIQTKNAGYGRNDNTNAGRQNKNQEANAGNGPIQQNDESSQIVQRVPRTQSNPERANVQCYNCNARGHYACDCPKPKVCDAKYFREHMLLAMKDEAGGTLNEEENDFMLDNAYGDETLEELSATVIMMAGIQPADENADAEPKYDAEAVSENLKEQDKIERDFYKGENEKVIIQHETQLAKKAFKARENSYLEDIVDLEEKLSSHDRILYKMRQSIQNIHMLGKRPKKVYDPFLKDSRVKRALFTSHVVAKSRNLGATFVVVKSLTTTNKDLYQNKNPYNNMSNDFNTTRMAPKRTSTSAAPAMTQATIRKLVVDSVSTALEAQAANMENADNTNRNIKPREALVARKCSYKEFMSCQLFNFKGTEGVVGLIRWLERTESIFSRSNCTEDCKVKYATGTLTQEALSWWNSFAQPIRIEEAYKITWSEFKKLLIKKYCPRTEVKKMEDKFYSLTVKGNDLKTYVRRFQKLAVLCPTMNRSLVHTRYNKTTYELIKGRKPNVQYFYVFGSLCYLKNDRNGYGKMKPKDDIDIKQRHRDPSSDGVRT
nr:reverse transcriptase domain-containing protein [Tanacetum cinerariifolium]